MLVEISLWLGVISFTPRSYHVPGIEDIMGNKTKVTSSFIELKL